MEAPINWNRWGGPVKAFLAFYLIPALYGIGVGLGVTSWLYLAFGGSVWTIAFVAAVVTTIFVILTQEMMY